MKIDPNIHYEFITEQQRYFNEKIIEGFTLFIKLTSAIVAGIFWLLTQNLGEKLRGDIASFVPWLITILGFCCALLIWANFFSWHGYRKSQANMIRDQKIVKYPRCFLYYPAEIMMTIIIFIVVIFAWRWNPFCV